MASYIYPQDLGTSPQNQNHMVFKARKIIGARGGAGNTNGSGNAPAFGGNLGEVVLPIPTGLNISYSQGWDQAQVAGTAAAAAGNFGSDLGMLEKAASAGDFGGSITAILGALDKPISAMQNVAAERFGMGGATPDETSGSGIAPEATGFIMTAPGAQSIAQAAQYSMGKRAIDQTMISYSGPGFRSFSFNFSFKPMSQRESIVVNQIVNFFKIQSAPIQEQQDFTRIYQLPAVFKIRFYYGEMEHTHIGKIGHCALTNIGVTYGGDKFSTFDNATHAPVQTDITLQFKEMELLNRQMLEADVIGGEQSYLASVGLEGAGAGQMYMEGDDVFVGE